MKDINTWVRCVDLMGTLGFTFELHTSRVTIAKNIGDELFEAKDSFTNVDELYGYLKGYRAAEFRFNGRVNK